MITFLGLDLPTWWFLIVGGIFSGYAILDGFDLGAGAMHLFFKKNESRRIALNAVGPVWDGNEVWLVIGGGTLFAGFPVLYASLFSAAYIPFMLFLAFIILRAVSIEFRSKETMKWWRNTWDIAYSGSSILLGLLLGVVLGNVLKGLPLDANYEFTGHWLDMLNPFALTVGITGLALMVVHGGIYLCIKTEGKLYDRVNQLLRIAIVIFIVAFVAVSIYTIIGIPHLSEQFFEHKILFIVPVLTVLSIANIPRLVTKKSFHWAFFFSSLTFVFLMILVAIELYPNLLIATNDINNSITIYNAASSEKSLTTMLIITAIGAPLVLIYTFIVYKTFWGKVKMDETSY